MNNTRAPFNNKDARLALQAVFDREQYNEAIFFGLGQVHNQPFTPDNVWRLDVPMVQPDLTKAKEYFKASGLPEGTPVKFLLMANQKDKGEVHPGHARPGRLQVEFDVVDSAAWNSKGKAYDYDLLLGTMTGIFDPDRPYGYLTKASGSNWLVGGYDSAQDERPAGRGQGRDRRGQAAGDLQAGRAARAGRRGHHLRAGSALG